MKTAAALAISLGIAIAVAVRLGRVPAPPARPSGSWEPTDATTR